MSSKFKRIAELYKQIGSQWEGLDWSDKALIDMYNSESFGTPVDERKNGFFIGKQYLTITVNAWREDIAKGQLKLWELYEDPRLPHWYLEKEFGDWPERMKHKPTFEQMFEDIFGQPLKSNSN